METALAGVLIIACCFAAGVFTEGKGGKKGARSGKKRKGGRR